MGNSTKKRPRPRTPWLLPCILPSVSCLDPDRSEDEDEPEDTSYLVGLTISILYLVYFLTSALWLKTALVFFLFISACLAVVWLPHLTALFRFLLKLIVTTVGVVLWNLLDLMTSTILLSVFFVSVEGAPIPTHHKTLVNTFHWIFTADISYAFFFFCCVIPILVFLGAIRNIRRSRTLEDKLSVDTDPRFAQLVREENERLMTEAAASLEKKKKREERRNENKKRRREEGGEEKRKKSKTQPEPAPIVDDNPTTVMEAKGKAVYLLDQGLCDMSAPKLRLKTGKVLSRFTLEQLLRDYRVDLMAEGGSNVIKKYRTHWPRRQPDFYGENRRKPITQTCRKTQKAGVEKISGIIKDSFYNEFGHYFFPDVMFVLTSEGNRVDLVFDYDAEDDCILLDDGREINRYEIKHQSLRNLLHRYVAATDNGNISQRAFRSLTAADSAICREYMLSEARVEEDSYMASRVPIRSVDNDNKFDSFHRRTIDILNCVLEENDLNQGKLVLRVAGDGRLTGKHIHHCMLVFSILKPGQETQSYKDQHTLNLTVGTEQYDKLAVCLKPSVADLDDLRRNGVWRHNETWYHKRDAPPQAKKIEVEIYFVSDWKFMAIALGINAANSFWFCLWCNCPKNQRDKLTKKWDRCNDMDTLIAWYESNNDTEKPVAGSKRVPIMTCVEFDHIHLDVLHAFLRVGDLLVNAFLDKVISQADVARCTKCACKTRNNKKCSCLCHKNVFTDISLAMKERSVTLNFWENKQKQLTWSPLMGNGLHSILGKEPGDCFPFEDYLFNKKDAIELSTLCEEFHHGLWPLLNQSEPYTLSSIKKYEKTAKNFVSKVKKASMLGNITPYLHALQHDVPDMMHQCKKSNITLKQMSCSPVELKNLMQVMKYFRKTTKDGGRREFTKSSVEQILMAENRHIYHMLNDHSQKTQKFHI
eukprot:Lithocolla_globosa_v1_NODE_352_length_4352_cov_9.852222.p1 type:complete len:929 gc:universal NODE_352_length_4352_cov_9.852222:1022-3808(+)